MFQKGRFKAKFILVPIAILFVVTTIVMWLWNGILPEITGVKHITYWQAMGILVLSKILFGGFSGCRKSGPRSRGDFKEKLKRMSPEQREKFRQVWKQKCHKNFLW
ncbi:hypothetical protein [Christiangramia flava]|nr:hypothetical protein [Christiangramia flava]